MVHIEELLSNAKRQITLIGAVSLQINWLKLATLISKKLKTSKVNMTIICESETWLFMKSLTTDLPNSDPRISYSDLYENRKSIFELPDYLKDNGASEANIKKLNIVVSHLDISMPILMVDSNIYYSLWLHQMPNDFVKLSKEDPMYESINNYIQSSLDPEKGMKFGCNINDETLELMDHNRVRRGIYPRSSFYDTDYNQWVIWGFIFDRSGKLLIHKRDENAKDNRGMWDKSVGGHVDYNLDADSSNGMARETVEELFTDELKKQDIKTWSITTEDMLFLGEWRPDKRKYYPFQEVKRYTNQWCYFRINKRQQLPSPRTFPDGQVKMLRVIADVFLFIAGESLNNESLGKLENSDYKLIDLADLKTAMNKSTMQEEVPGFDKDVRRKIPVFSPDLNNIMTGELRNTLIKFSSLIKKVFA